MQVAAAPNSTVSVPAALYADGVDTVGARHFHLFAHALPALPPCNIEYALASPLLATAWSQAIAHFWEAGLASGQIASNAPVYLFDPAPGGGHCMWLLLRVLRRHAERLALDFRYLVCGSEETLPDALLEHPYLRPWIDAGKLDVVCRDGDDWFLPRQGRRLDITINPAVILARGWLATFPQHLYGVHYGQVKQGLIEASAAGFTYHWAPQSGERSASGLENLMSHYARRLSSAPVPVPGLAWEALDALGKLAGRRYLLLCVDRGCWSEQQLRLGALRLPQQTGELAPGINFHALALLQEQADGRTWSRQQDDTGFVLHAAWCNQHHATDDDAWWRICAALETVHPDDVACLPASVGTSPAACLATLRRGGYDPRMLESALPALLAQVAALSDSARAAWRDALRLTWTQHYPSSPDDGLGQQLGGLAIHLGDWPLARDCFHCAALSGNADALHALACIDADTGNLDQALSLLQETLRHMPMHHPSLDLHVLLEQRRARWSAMDWYRPAIADAQLCLEPFGTEHISSLLQQYRDPQIAPMTCLPPLHTPEQVQSWLDDYHTEGGCYAVMHHDHGFVGMTGTKCADGAAHFYFWIGADFQGHGFGRRAAQLTFRQLEACGIRDIFTAVFPDNTRSLKALAALGLRQLDADPADIGNETQLWFWRAARGDCPIAATAKLQRLRDALDARYFSVVNDQPTNDQSSVRSA